MGRLDSSQELHLTLSVHASVAQMLLHKVQNYERQAAGRPNSPRLLNAMLKSPFATPGVSLCSLADTRESCNTQCTCEPAGARPATQNKTPDSTRGPVDTFSARGCAGVRGAERLLRDLPGALALQSLIWEAQDKMHLSASMFPRPMEYFLVYVVRRMSSIQV